MIKMTLPSELNLQKTIVSLTLENQLNLPYQQTKKVKPLDDLWKCRKTLSKVSIQSWQKFLATLEGNFLHPIKNILEKPKFNIIFNGKRPNFYS